METITRIIRSTFIAGTSLALFACASTDKQNLLATSEARVHVAPKAETQKTITSFSHSLQCMDNLFQRYHIPSFRVSAQSVLDHTSDVQTATKDMMISAISTMSRKSKVLRFVDLGHDVISVSEFHQLHSNPNFTAPDYFIRIGAPQVDRSAISERQGMALRVSNDFGSEFSRNRSVAMVSLDLNLGEVDTLEFLPGITSTNSIAVTQRGKAADASGSIKKLGALFNIGLDSAEGLNHSVRTLVELGAIELMGRLTQTPYWECLDIESTNPLVQSQIRDWFLALTDKERLQFTQSKLEALDYYQGPLDGQVNSSLRSAITLFKLDHNLTANSRIDFDLYHRLITDATPVKTDRLALLTQKTLSNPVTDDGNPLFPQERALTPQQTMSITGHSLQPLKIMLETPRGARPVYKQGERLTFRFNTSEDAYVYCYYQKADGNIFKVFPNRFTPNARIAAGEKLMIPSTNHFELKLDHTGPQAKVMCMASYEDIDSKLPAFLGKSSLRPLPINTLTDVHKHYSRSSNTRPALEILPITII